MSIKSLTTHFLAQRDSNALRDFLIGLLTPEEIDQLSLRLEIVKSLKARQTQREVAQRLGVGIATVSRGAREIKKGRFKYVN